MHMSIQITTARQRSWERIMFSTLCFCQCVCLQGSPAREDPQSPPSIWISVYRDPPDMFKLVHYEACMVSWYPTGILSYDFYFKSIQFRYNCFNCDKSHLVRQNPVTTGPEVSWRLVIWTTVCDIRQLILSAVWKVLVVVIPFVNNFLWHEFTIHRDNYLHA